MELTPLQKIFVVLCHQLEIPNEQVAICLCLFTEEDLMEALNWFDQESEKRDRFLTPFEFMEHLTNMVLDKKYKIFVS